MVAMNTEVEEVLRRIEAWPVDARLAVARGVLATLAPASKCSPAEWRGLSSDDVVGLWSTGGDDPSDAECDRILVDELLRKQG